MRLLSLALAFMLAAAFTIACGDKGPSLGPKLTDADVKKYIVAYKNLKAAGPGLAEQAKAAKPGQGAASNPTVDKAIKDAGFASYPDFVRVNARVALAFSAGQGNMAMSDTAAQMSDGEKQIREALANPNVPEAAKVEMRKSLEEMQKTYASNKAPADAVMGVMNAVVDADDAKVVAANRAALEAAFQGR
jgi:hypothetical protein